MTEAPTPFLPLDDLLASVVPSAQRLAAAARSVGAEAPVPSCPEWHVGALVGHVGYIHRWVLAILDQEGGPPPEVTFPPPEGDAMFDWVEEGAEALVARLRAVGPEAPAWNFARQVPVAGFWFRRQAHETAVHAIDAQLAAGLAPSMPAAIAADGIDELLFSITSRVARRRVAAGDALPAALGSLHIHCTDVDGEWLVQGGDDWSTLAMTREHAKGDAALRGTALDLECRLLNRGHGGDVVGDPTVLDRWSEAVRF